MFKLALLVLISTAIAHKMDLFTQPGFWGKQLNFDVTSQCSNLPAKMDRNLESANTHGGCMRLYSGKDCTGESAIVGVGMPGSCTPHSNINECGWGNRAVSLKAC